MKTFEESLESGLSDWHPRRCRFPHEGHLLRREPISGVNQVTNLPLKSQGLGGKSLSRNDGIRVLFAKTPKCGNAETLLPANLLHFENEGI